MKNFFSLGEIIHPTERTLVNELSAEGVYPMMEVIGKFAVLCFE